MAYTKKRFGVRSAYGQLVLIVFLPIAVLASVGALLVFFETTRAVKSEQDILAQAALVRYEPIVRKFLPDIAFNDYLKLDSDIKAMEGSSVTGALSLTHTRIDITRRDAADKLARLSNEQHVLRIGVFDNKGIPLLVVGSGRDAPWGVFDSGADKVWRLSTTTGTAYGMPLYVEKDNHKQRFWLFVEMDNEPLTIAYYRILLALAITGLTTLLLLLLILNLYAKRWIAPVYEMRLFLQKLSPQTLGKPLIARTDGEFYLLQKELNLALKRLNLSFKELKNHSDETEADLQLAFDEMEMQNISIRKARDEAVQASQSKSTFLASISHELRTPLNAIDGFINLLAKSQNFDAKQRLYVQTIQKSSAHLLALISDVLDFSKIEAGKLALDNHEFDLTDTVYEVADMLSPTMLDKGLRASVMVGDGVPKTLMGDRLRTKQILTNLLGNAVKFTEQGGLSVQVVCEGSFLKILVSDTGRGIDKTTQGELFKSFGQGDVSITRRYGGTGLGLVISKELVTLLGGEIGFFDNNEAGLGAGTTFWFSLPCRTQQPDKKDPIAPKKACTVLAWIAHSPAMQVLKHALKTQGITLETRQSLAQLLETLTQKNDYDWVIADSFGQHGDVLPLISQIRLRYSGRLLVYGFEVGLDSKLLHSHGADALHEPLDKRKLYALLDNTQSPLENSAFFCPLSVLAVDDHPPNLWVLEALLTEMGASVVTVDSGFAALECMTKTLEGSTPPFDMIFMDIQMPAMSGIQTASAIRKLENDAKIAPVPIVALSAHGVWHDMQVLHQAGINDYATKPIARQSLVDLLQKWQKKRFALPDTDWQDGLSRALDNHELAQKLFDKLISSLKDEQTAFQSAWANQDHASLQETVHRLLGATQYTGTPRLRMACQKLHDACLESSDVSTHLGQPYQEVMQALTALQILDQAAYPPKTHVP